MPIPHLDEMSVEKLREAAMAVDEAWNDALASYKAELALMPRRMNAAQRERAAYLKGVVTGAARATREIEKRAPLKLYGS